ncbi:MAG: Dyp-type peroxidase [Caldilineaceae bacterium]|nr:Dyp-type peroxidase [Caldilineaceae bacterium]
MSHAALAQHGVLTDPTEHVEYLTFVVEDVPEAAAVAEAMSRLTNISHSIRQKDTTAALTLTIGFSANGWSNLFPDRPMPADLHPFVELRDGPRHFPSTPGDIFIMVKSHRLDLNFQAAKYLAPGFAPIARLIDDTPGYKYLDDRDLIDFVDGTENPHAAERQAAVLNMEEPYPGSSYLIVQRYVHKTDKWEAQSVAEQEGVIGRTKFDDIELDDAVKKPYAHNVKSKVEIDGVEIKMLRQNRAFGNVLEHGTMFVGFAKSPAVIETSLRQMIIADEDGNYDHLLDFADAVTGMNFFVPPKAFVDQFA